MTEDKDHFAELPDNEAKILPPDYSLKKMIGENVNIKEVFTEEVVEKAQGTIDLHQDKFLEWAINDVASLEAAYQKALDNAASNEAAVTEIEEISATLKARAGTFNFGLATSVAKSLNSFCQIHRKPTGEHLTVIRKHIDTLSVVFNKNITGDGGEVGKELLDNLFKLVEKYK